MPTFVIRMKSIGPGNPFRRVMLEFLLVKSNAHVALIVRKSLLSVGKNFESSINFFYHAFSLRRTVPIRMVLSCKTSVRPLELMIGGLFGYTEECVIASTIQ